MSEFKVGDRVVVKDGVPYTKLHGCEGEVTKAGDFGCTVDFGDQYCDVPFRYDELIKVNPEPRFLKTGDKVRVRPHLIDGVVTPLPTGTLEVTRDQTQADIYVQVRKWNGHFWEGYGINASDLELAEDEQAEPPTEPETPPVDALDPAAFRVGDWVRLKPGHPWEGDVWAAQPGEIIGYRQGDPDWYEVRFLDAVVWHTPDALEAVYVGGDILDEPQPPEGVEWYAIQAAQYDGADIRLAITYDPGIHRLARMWLRSYDAFDPGEPFAQWCVELSASDCWNVVRKFDALAEIAAPDK